MEDHVTSWCWAIVLSLHHKLETHLHSTVLEKVTDFIKKLSQHTKSKERQTLQNLQSWAGKNKKTEELCWRKQDDKPTMHEIVGDWEQMSEKPVRHGTHPTRARRSDQRIKLCYHTPPIVDVIIETESAIRKKQLNRNRSSSAWRYQQPYPMWNVFEYLQPRF